MQVKGSTFNGLYNGVITQKVIIFKIFINCLGKLKHVMQQPLAAVHFEPFLGTALSQNLHIFRKELGTETVQKVSLLFNKSG
jgi:hypothetical protein